MTSLTRRFGSASKILAGVILVLAIGIFALNASRETASGHSKPSAPSAVKPVSTTVFRERMPFDTSGYSLVVPRVKPWEPFASLQEIGDHWKNAGAKINGAIDAHLATIKSKDATPGSLIPVLINKAVLYNYEGEPDKAYVQLERARSLLGGDPSLESRWLYTIAYHQGVASLRRGENENCIMCRGESSCILPISTKAVHTNPDGSHRAIRHFTEYLEKFPSDLEVRWLLNLAHMTLGEHPEGVDPRFLISLERFTKSEFDIGRFRDIGDRVGVNRLNQAGGGILEDFDNDGLLDLAATSFDPTQVMAFYRNQGDGKFEERTESAGLTDQLGGLFCGQTDYNNDGYMDIFIPRGAWLPLPMRPTLLKNNGDGSFADVTEAAGLMDPVNSNSAQWADYDNDGWLDLFICCENQPNRLYHNKGDGSFEELAISAGLITNQSFCKGANWIDFDNDRYPDIFMNFLNGSGRLFRNNKDGSFSDVTMPMGINGPRIGFSCWAWDYNNDGWLDIWASCYERTLKDVVKGMIGEPHGLNSNKLYRNEGGERFVDVTKEAGLDMVFATMGSNFGDFDNDGFLDMYLGTGEPSISTLIPNRMFRNVGGTRFAEITGSSGTGHLQKGHGVACGDWDRDGDTDIFIEMGGAINGDKYHNVLFENPGQGNHWLTVKLVGKKTNRAAIGARIKVVTAGESPLTVRRLVSTGSSFGANPLQQTIGLAKADRVATLEITWPTSGTTQVFRDIPTDQAIEITEFADNYKSLGWKPIASK
ncbi:CRTAC1 family protein [Singulisphaera rosea]